MTWFKVDDSFGTHPKVLGIPRKDRAPAVGLWTLAGVWCARNLTDGYLGSHMLGELGVPDRYGLVLVQARLWHSSQADDCDTCKERGLLPIRAGFLFHDWEDWQPVSADVQLIREARGKSAREANHRRWHKSRGIINPDCEFCQRTDRSTDD